MLNNLNNLHSDLPFLSERKKIKVFNKLVCNFYEKALNHGLVLKKIS